MTLRVNKVALRIKRKASLALRVCSPLVKITLKVIIMYNQFILLVAGLGIVLAKSMIEGGKVQYNGQRCKASKMVEVGATIRLTQGTDEKTIIVKGLSDKRLAAPLAQALYEETSESQTLRLERAELRKMNNLYAPHPDTKPDKKMRRQLLLLKSQQS